MPPELDLNESLGEIAPPTVVAPSSAAVVHGHLFPPQQQILLYSSDQWEEFIREWVQSLRSTYAQVARLTGAGDHGIDVAGLTSTQGLRGIWDCFQCKHYEDSLTPTVAYQEIAKIIYYAFEGYFTVPRSYFFVAPKGCGPKLGKMLLDPDDLKSKIISEWSQYCANRITSTKTVELEGPLLTYVQGFDFSIFSSKSSLDIIDAHRATPYHAGRFGGGLPNRPPALAAPTAISPIESEYLTRLYEVYSEAHGSPINTSADLQAASQELSDHLDRQREWFYSAEALRNFARDTVPEGTFEDLQSEVYAGVIDLEQLSHPNSMTRLTVVTQAAVNLAITSNGLISVTRTQDKKGICHQLANEKRLKWKKP